MNSFEAVRARIFNHHQITSWVKSNQRIYSSLHPAANQRLSPQYFLMLNFFLVFGVTGMKCKLQFNLKKLN